MATEAYKRTTVKLRAETYRRLKRAAIDRDRSLQEIINEALELYLRQPGGERRASSRFRSYRMGRIDGRLTRDEIYGDG